MAAESMPFSSGRASLIVVIEAASPAAARGVRTPIMSDNAALHTSSQLATSACHASLSGSGEELDSIFAATLLGSTGRTGTSIVTTWPVEFTATMDTMLPSELRIAADALPAAFVRVYMSSASGCADDLLVKIVLVPMNDNVPFCSSPRAVGSPLCENPSASR